MTDTAGAQSFVLTSLVVSGALAVVKDAATKQLPPIRLGIGLAFTGLTLATLAQFAPVPGVRVRCAAARVVRVRLRRPRPVRHHRNTPERLTLL
jgi:glycerol uptake facilitator-like aquaporin